MKLRQASSGEPFIGTVGQTLVCLGGDNWAPGAASSPTGPAGSLAFFDNPSGSLTGEAELIAEPIDQFNRPQIRDIRDEGGVGAVFRQGAWQADGDPQNLQGEGIVIYGEAGGTIDPSNGMIGRVKADRFQLRRIIGGVDIGSAFRVDPTALHMTNDSGVRVCEITRADGNTFFAVLRIGSATGPRILTGTGTPEGAVVGSVGDLYTDTTGGASTVLYVKESGAATNTGWVAK